jgi:uncharacterized membrane protein
MEREQYEDGRAERLSKALGWFSIGLGVAEVAAPGAVSRLIGVREDDRTDTLLRTFGARELASGLGILSQPYSAKWVWSRVAGDAADLTCLVKALRSDDGAERRKLVNAVAAVAGVTALDVLCASILSRGTAATRSKGQVRVEEVVTINKSIEEVYRFWRNFENLPKFMRHIESVQVLGDRRSRWRVKAPGGSFVEWEAEIVQDTSDEWIAWRTLQGSDVHHSGSVRFQRAPGARGTEVRVQLQYVPPAGQLGRRIAQLFGEEPEQQIHEDLHRFKQLMETGEVTISEGIGLRRPAQPPKSREEIEQLMGVRS